MDSAEAIPGFAVETIFRDLRKTSDSLPTLSLPWLRRKHRCRHKNISASPPEAQQGATMGSQVSRPDAAVVSPPGRPDAATDEPAGRSEGTTASAREMTFSSFHLLLFRFPPPKKTSLCQPFYRKTQQFLLQRIRLNGFCLRGCDGRWFSSQCSRVWQGGGPGGLASRLLSRVLRGGGLGGSASSLRSSVLRGGGPASSPGPSSGMPGRHPATPGPASAPPELLCLDSWFSSVFNK
ncbi:uncharacterized protein LOC118566330 [Fundulus heteroclitus]|uniref:uncharacterized protein LOC118566330 n=1 Tax=Fundulus heteroclitus TaxID=8078 RepID=UPI00165A8CBC|nr:uncharacterized protein LOC118566330 [Fundulus heteroclitus]